MITLELARQMEPQEGPGRGPWGMFGSIYLPCQPSLLLATCERPWRDNRPFVSCIPPGTYPLRLTRFKDRYWTVEICNVPGRSLIKVHRGNYPYQVQGCVLTGLRVGLLKNGPAVLSSAVAFSRFWAAFSALVGFRYTAESGGMTKQAQIRVVDWTGRCR